MPFVPLGSRKRIEVILDHDKERLRNEMHSKDYATVKLHHQEMPGRSGYRYANHPITMGPVRGPPAPFKAANKPWAPPDDEPNGMAAMRDMEQAPIGGYTDGSHAMNAETLRKTRSVPALLRTMAANPVEEGGKTLGEQAKEAANPLSIEHNRWKKLAEVTKNDLKSMPDLLSTTKKERVMPQKPVVIPGSLVNFPKYMLFENSHLKYTEFQRFCDGEEKKRREHAEKTAAFEAALAKGETPTPISTGRETASSENIVPFGTASWGAPRLRGHPDLIKRQWAGNPMPTGKGQKTSSLFR